MSNHFYKKPTEFSDNNLWAPKAEEMMKTSGIGVLTTRLYDDSGTLKISTGRIGINDGTVEGISNIDTVTTISIAGVSSGNWAEVYMSVSSTVVTFAAIDISGATTEQDIPSDFLNAYVSTKDGYYINSARRCIGIVWKTGGGALSHIIQTKFKYDDLFASTIYADSSSGIDIRDDDRNLAIHIHDGGNIGFGTSDIEAWSSDIFACEFNESAIAGYLASPRLYLLNNCYLDGAGNWKYKSTDEAARIWLRDDGTINFDTVTSGSADATITWVAKLKIDNANDYIGIGGYAGGSDRDCAFYFSSGAKLTYVQSTNRIFVDSCDLAVSSTTSSGVSILDPASSGSTDIGSASNYYDDINAKDFLDRSGVTKVDGIEAWNIIKNLKNEETTGFCKKIEDTGHNRLKFSCLPSWVWDDALEEVKEDIEYDDNTIISNIHFESQNKNIPIFQKGDKIAKKGEKSRVRIIKKTRKNEITGEKETYNEVQEAAEGVSYGGLISILLGVTKELVNRVEQLEKK